MFLRKNGNDADQTFSTSIMYWARKLSGMSHQLNSTVKYAGEKKERLLEIIAEYNSITSKLFQLAYGNSESEG